MQIGYIRVSKSDASQVLDLQRDAMIAAGVDPERILRIWHPAARMTAWARRETKSSSTINTRIFHHPVGGCLRSMQSLTPKPPGEPMDAAIDLRSARKRLEKNFRLSPQIIKWGLNI